MHEPADAQITPRFTGPRTFARLPYLTDLSDVDVAIFGMPWDGATTYRSGARFGPEGVRSASVMLRPYNPVQDVMVFGIGGDHSVTLAKLRAAAAVHGPLGLVHLDSHGDIWESYFGRPYNHGTLFRRALEEGLIDPDRSLQAGMRG